MDWQGLRNTTVPFAFERSVKIEILLLRNKNKHTQTLEKAIFINLPRF